MEGCSFLISKRLFQPFHDILDSISRFNLKSPDQPELPKTSTKEFSELNNFVRQMTSKARRDYVSLKEFSENASHEMQTPIAVAQGKLELLSVSEGLNPNQLELIQSARASLTKLSKMGKSLSLLTKIENLEFQNPGQVDFSEINIGDGGTDSIQEVPIVRDHDNRVIIICQEVLQPVDCIVIQVVGRLVHDQHIWVAK